MRLLIKLFTLIFLVAGLTAALWLPKGEQTLGSYATSLRGRTRGQVMNATRAARALEGKVIEAGQELSFNRTVGSWTPDRGYVLAPVSYDGELIVDWGGGVCQTSTTLYNAALLAGLRIVERHHHAWAPGYIPPGRDAAVAQLATDLRLRNPYPYPVRLHAVLTEASIGFAILGRDAGPQADVVSETLATLPPSEVLKNDDRLPAGQLRLLNHGKPGLRTAVYRSFLHGPRAGRRELVSQDSYPAMNRVTLIGCR